MTIAKGDKSLAFKLYLWNCDISEAFYLPLHFCEILCRNAIHSALMFKLGDGWYTNPTFLKVLAPQYQGELANAVSDERQQHGVLTTPHHIVSALSFGFWNHLATKRFDRLLWNRGIRNNFPNVPIGKNRDDLHNLIMSVRQWRNRIAHHRTIFDRGPTKKHQEIIELTTWVCRDTATWVNSASKVAAIINLRPS